MEWNTKEEYNAYNLGFKEGCRVTTQENQHAINKLKEANLILQNTIEVLQTELQVLRYDRI